MLRIAACSGIHAELHEFNDGVERSQRHVVNEEPKNGRYDGHEEHQSRRSVGSEIRVFGPVLKGQQNLEGKEPEEQNAQRAQTDHLCYGTFRRIPTRVPLDQEGQQRQCGEECEKRSVDAEFWAVCPAGVISIWHGSGSFCTVSWICRRTAS